MEYSFSRVSSYDICPQQFYLKYIEQNKYGINNFYAEVGKLMHYVLEKILDGSLELDNASMYFAKNIKNYVFTRVKESTMDKTYDACISYLVNLDMDFLSGYRIIGVEIRCNYMIDDNISFLGYIDLLVQNEQTKDYILIDHKSSKYPLKKDGSVLKSEQENFEHYKRQIYLYSHYVFLKYGKYPTELWWNHFKSNKIVKIPFDIHEANQALEWFMDTIKKIYNDETFLPKPSYMQCNVLCDYREECEYKKYGYTE